MKLFTGVLLFLICFFPAIAQQKPVNGIITGTVMDEKSKALEGATVQLILLADTLQKRSTTTDKNGHFSFSQVMNGHYRLSISYVSLQKMVIDSIHFREERADFNLNDLVLKPASGENLDAVVVYAEKPLVQTKDGNITFNAGESALSASSSASELLENVPLVSKNPDGKITVRGKEPKILIDDKPVELNLQQVQDLLESMPGSSIEKIEVMTNPPPQYASEQGGVINIITKKGKVGISGRIAITGGTRGEKGMNGNFNVRKQGLSISLNGGISHNRYTGYGYSIRNNIYNDSSNFFNTNNNYLNRNLRPNARLNIDYDITKNHIINAVFSFNQNDFDNRNTTEYRNINRNEELWRLSRRQVENEGMNISPSFTLTYTWKGKPGETFRIVSGMNYSKNESNRDFFQEFYNPDYTPNGIDSFQQQLNLTKVNGHNTRVSYDKMLGDKKTFISTGAFYQRSNNHVMVDASYRKKPEGTMEPLGVLSNDFWFHQTIKNLRGSVKRIFMENFSATAGVSLENTHIWFELLMENRDVKNDYWTWLPFANLNRTWKNGVSMTLAYRRSIRRPGIGELNPTVDFSDPYNVRFGNENLEASTAHNFDFVAGRTRPKFYVNLGVGYNIVQDVFSQVRTLLPDGKTQITWENISGRREYEVSTWDGVTLTKKLKVNWSASFIYSEYSEFDRTVRKFRNGGSFTSNLNASFSPKDVWNITSSVNLNRFANPQGYARWTTSMNVGVQRKFVKKKLVITANVIDPFRQQQNRVFTYGPNFNFESFSFTETRNYRLSVAYNFTLKKR